MALVILCGAGFETDDSTTPVIHQRSGLVDLSEVLREATVLAGVFFGASYCILGFLVGYVIEGRHRDREAERVIRAQADALHATRTRLVQSEKLAALGQLATAIAHEVRNPLAVMRSAAQGVLEATSSPDAFISSI